MSRTTTVKLFLRFALLMSTLTLAACGGSSSSDGGGSEGTSVSGTISQAASGTAVGTTAGGTSGTAPVTTSASTPTAMGDPVFFSAANYSVAQDQGSVTLTVLRVGDASAAVTVQYATLDGTAAAGADYGAVAGTLQWAENDSTAKTITVTLAGTPPFAGTKSFSVALSNPSATAQIATPDIALVNISGNAATGAGTLELSSAAYTVAQTSADLSVTVNRTNGDGGAVSVHYATNDLTAAAGTDYTAAAGTLEWADGDASSKTFLVPVSAAKPFTGVRTFGIVLSNPTSGAALGSPSGGTVTIAGQSSAAIGTLRLSASNYSVSQSSGSLKFSVARSSGSAGAVSVGYQTASGTALAGRDFTAGAGTLSWADGDTAAKSFSVTVSNAAPFSGNKYFSVVLSAPANGATISSPGTAAVVIAGDEATPVGSLQFTAATYAVVQGAGTVTFGVQRTGGANGTVSVAYAAKSGTAVAGDDFTSAGGMLQWANGDATTKTFTVAISNASPFSGTKSFSLGLSSPSGGAVIGNPGSAGVNIAGDAATAVGKLQIASSNYKIVQSAHTLTVTVNRTGGATNAVSATYATSNGTAVAGTDFTAASGTLNWADGDAKSKSFTVNINSSAPFSGTKSFGLSLSHPGGGAALSTPASAAVTITGASAAAAGTLQFSAAGDDVGQSDGSATLTVERVGSSVGAVSVAYATNNGSAAAGIEYSAENGTLNWSDGDSSSKSIVVPVSDSAPFSGTKNFTLVLSNPGGGGAIGSPATVNVTISGNGANNSGASAGPSAPSNLTITGESANGMSLSWGAASPGGSPLSHYKIYRNGSSYATTTNTNYSDNNAANATSPSFNSAANTYAYAVSAVDSQGNEGPQTTQATFNVYYNGLFNWAGDYSYSAWANYRDNSGGPESGPYDIAVTITGAYGGFQPYAGNLVPQWDLEVGSFGYISMDLKPTNGGQKWRLSMISRLPPGDVYPWASVNITNYGPVPVAGKWATYKIPLSALSIGKTGFEGSISGNTLTVSNVDWGVGVDAGGFITGNGVKPGTYIVGHNANGGAGTYTVYPSQYVSSTAMTEQRTGAYKFDIADQTGASYNKFYMDNVKFTRQ